MEIAASSSSSSGSSSSSKSSQVHSSQSFSQSGQKSSSSSADSLLRPFETTEASLLPRVNEVNRLHRDALEGVGATESATKGFRVRRSHPSPLPHSTPMRKQFRSEHASRSADDAGSAGASQHRMFEHTSFQLAEHADRAIHRSGRGLHDSLRSADFTESLSTSGDQRTNTGDEATDGFRSSTEK